MIYASQVASKASKAFWNLYHQILVSSPLSVPKIQKSFFWISLKIHWNVWAQSSSSHLVPERIVKTSRWSDISQYKRLIFHWCSTGLKANSHNQFKMPTGSLISKCTVDFSSVEVGVRVSRSQRTGRVRELTIKFWNFPFHFCGSTTFFIGSDFWIIEKFNKSYWLV